MLDIERLNDLREVLNLKGLCIISKVNYSTIKSKTLYFRKKSTRGALTELQSKKLQAGLERKGLFLCDK